MLYKATFQHTAHSAFFSISTRLMSDFNNFENGNKRIEEVGQLCVAGNFGKPRVIFFQSRTNKFMAKESI